MRPNHPYWGPMLSATITVMAREPGPSISPFLHGQFIEHLGSLVYDGLWSAPNPKFPINAVCARASWTPCAIWRRRFFAGRWLLRRRLQLARWRRPARRPSDARDFALGRRRNSRPTRLARTNSWICAAKSAPSHGWPPTSVRVRRAKWRTGSSIAISPAAQLYPTRAQKTATKSLSM